MVAGISNYLDWRLVIKGRNHHLLHKAVTNKNKKQIREEEESKEAQHKNIPDLRHHIDKLKAQMMEKNRDYEIIETYKIILRRRSVQNVIDKHGNILKLA